MYIELDRQFKKNLSEDIENNDNNFDLLGFNINTNRETIGWSDLQKKKRVVILSEAGAGKTAEIQNLTKKLREQNKNAFFFRLESLCKGLNEFPVSFEIGNNKEFEQWLKSGEEGWVLLDSIDEAKLISYESFKEAIKILSIKLEPALQQAHIILTGRGTAWHSKVDLELCNKRLPLDNLDQNHDEIFEIYQLDVLNKQQIKKFSEKQGISNIDDFFNEIKKSEAEIFATRPQDLIDLIIFWKEKNYLGSRTELIENNIDRKLKEYKKKRAVKNSLSHKDYYKAAQLLAAAVILCKESSIKQPEEEEPKNNIGIPSNQILKDLQPKQIDTLLSQPIFDIPTYGVVRFHHRSVREYLAATWFYDLLKQQKFPRRKIESLFFRKQYGQDIVTPSLRPILPWLAIKDEKICKRIYEIAPEIFFEGGDPSQINDDTREEILTSVCKHIANKTIEELQYDTVAVQRFANQNLTKIIRALLEEYKENNDVIEFLLNMISAGKNVDLEQEVIEIIKSKNISYDNYTQISAIQACKAISSEITLEEVRQFLLDNTYSFHRNTLLELIDGIYLTTHSFKWLKLSLKKCELKEKYYYDLLSQKLVSIFKNCEIEFILPFLKYIKELLNIEPYHKYQSYQLSKKYTWLLEIATALIEYCISKKYEHIIFEPSILQLIQIISVVKKHDHTFNLNTIGNELPKQISAWKALNWALFNSVLQQVNEKNRVINYKWYCSYLNFEDDDFEKVLGFISNKEKTLINKKIALYLAFTLYEKNGKKEVQLNKLKEITSKCSILSTLLSECLTPPQYEDEIKYEIKRKKQQQAYEKREQKKHNDWKQWLQNNLADLIYKQKQAPGILTKPLLYLYEKIEPEQPHSLSGYIKSNWFSLKIPFGKDIAQFYRDSAVNFWRNYEPVPCSKEVGLTSRNNWILFGLTGLEIERCEDPNWLNKLSIQEIELICRYAYFDYNRFPIWFPELFKIQPQIVIDFLWNEIEFQLSNELENPRTFHLLHCVTEQGKWAWDSLAPKIANFIRKEPQIIDSLKKLIKILTGSNLKDSQLQKLASKKCKQLKKIQHLACWYALWTAVEPELAISCFEKKISHIKNGKEQIEFAMLYLTYLVESHYQIIIKRDAFKKPKYLKKLYLLMYEYIKDDIDCSDNVVRDRNLSYEAQKVRNTLLNIFDSINGKEAYYSILDLSRNNSNLSSNIQNWALNRAKAHAERDGDIEKWNINQVLDYQNFLESTPTTHKELFDLAVMRLDDLKAELEDGDYSIAKTLQKANEETEMRNFIAYILDSKSNWRYTISQEEEMADAKRPDIRFKSNNGNAVIPVELKLADKNWSGEKLYERLENQLCGDYLRDEHSERGIFLLVHIGIGKDNKSKKWVLPNRESVNFCDLILRLQSHWEQQLSKKFTNINDIKVIGIDLTKRFK